MLTNAGQTSVPALIRIFADDRFSPTANDVGLVWPPAGAPIVIAIYYTQEKPETAKRNEPLAAVAHIACATL